jgi:predicted Na+-dependent transporter
MKLIRTAQATSLVLLLILLYGFVSLNMMGGVPKSNLLHLWIFSPAIVGSVLLPYITVSMIESRLPKLINRSKAFLTGISAQILTVIVVYAAADQGASAFLFVSPVIFYLGLGMTFFLQKRAEAKEA